MPIWLRNFTYQKLHEYYDKTKKESNPNPPPNSQPLTKKNSLNPDYISKVLKK